MVPRPLRYHQGGIERGNVSPEQPEFQRFGKEERDEEVKGRTRKKSGICGGADYIFTISFLLLSSEVSHICHLPCTWNWTTDYILRGWNETGKWHSPFRLDPQNSPSKTAHSPSLFCQACQLQRIREALTGGVRWWWSHLRERGQQSIHVGCVMWVRNTSSLG